MTESYRYTIAGRVQGVGFRQAVRAKALALGLNGCVYNRQDGRVAGTVSGRDAAKLVEFRAFLNHGPAAARVESVAWEPDDAIDGACGFHILRD